MFSAESGVRVPVLRCLQYTFRWLCLSSCKFGGPADCTRGTFVSHDDVIAVREFEASCAGLSAGGPGGPFGGSGGPFGGSGGPFGGSGGPFGGSGGGVGGRLGGKYGKRHCLQL